MSAAKGIDETTCGSEERAPEDLDGPEVVKYCKRSWLNSAFFFWLARPSWLAYRQRLREEDTPFLLEQFRTELVLDDVAKWNEARAKGGKRRLWKEMLMQDPFSILFGILLLSLQGAVVTVARPLALRYVVREVAAGPLTTANVLLYAFALSCMCLVDGLFYAWGRHLDTDYASVYFFRHVSTIVLDKCCRAAPDSSRPPPTNLVGSDIPRIIEQLRILGMGPACIGGFSGAITLLAVILGWSSLIGLAVVFGILLVNMKIGNIAKRAEKQNLEAADFRVMLLKQAIEMIKGLKYFAWEAKCMRQLVEARRKQCFKVKKAQATLQMSLNVGRLSPFMACVATFVFYGWILGNPMEAGDIFAALLVFMSMRLSLIIAPNAYIAGQQILVSLARVEKCVDAPDFPERVVIPNSEGLMVDVHFQECTVSGVRDTGSSDGSGARKEFVLRDVAMQVHPGTLVAILGEVGAGKSSLVSAMIGACAITGDGARARTRQRVGIVPQKPALLNSSIYENIVRGKPFDADRFAKAIDVAQFARDLEELEDSVDTIIGERGTTLSGGQQMRLCIAQVMYDQPELVILDDPLAALDHVVGSHVFDALREYVGASPDTPRALVMVLNQMNLLSHFDHALWLENGAVIASGTPEEVTKSLGLDLDTSQRANGHVAEESKREGHTCDAVKPDGTSRHSFVGSALHVEMVAMGSSRRVSSTLRDIGSKVEARATGSVNFGVYHTYIKSMGYTLAGLFIFISLLSYTSMAFGDRWLALWIRNIDPNEDTDAVYPLIYTGSVLTFGFLLVVSSWVFAEGCMRAARTLHDECLLKVLKAPMSWFEEMPTGRILSRFSSDLSTVDLHLSQSLDNAVQLVFTVVVMLVTICIFAPLVAFAGIFVFVFYGVLGVLVDRTNREIKRMRDHAMAPVQTNLAEVLSHVSLMRVDDGSLRSFFMERHARYTDIQNRYMFSSTSMMSFSTFLSYIIACIFVFASAIFLLGFGDPEPEEVALSLAYVFLVPYFGGMASGVAVMCGHNFTSLERLLELKSDSVPEEAWPPGTTFLEEPTERSGEEWPSAGSIVFEDVSLRYRQELPLALTNLSFQIPGGQRVGIVGRTGAGKSSLTTVLFRFVQPCRGRVLIDGRDTTSIDLQQLRSSISMIPQQPVLIQGSVRTNLDPYGEVQGGDAALLHALRQAQIPDLDLDDTIDVSGSGVSSGECQLLSFARCLLRTTKIVLLDEPTASVDTATDAKLQKLVRVSLANRTLVCIAHRLQTIIDFDQILVMDAGTVGAMGIPRVLLDDRSSYLSQLVDGGGSDTLRLTLEDLLAKSTEKSL